jgi:hypothetical protein
MENIKFLDDNQIKSLTKEELEIIVSNLQKLLSDCQNKLKKNVSQDQIKKITSKK